MLHFMNSAATDCTLQSWNRLCWDCKTTLGAPCTQGPPIHTLQGSPGCICSMSPSSTQCSLIPSPFLTFIQLDHSNHTLSFHLSPFTWLPPLCHQQWALWRLYELNEMKMKWKWNEKYFIYPRREILCALMPIGFLLLKHSFVPVTQSPAMIWPP